MFQHRHLSVIFGLAILIAGFVVFDPNNEASTTWARWFLSPLLWFAGIALVVGWIVQTVSTVSTARAKQDELIKPLAKAAQAGN